jgi:hypothetical protein
MGYGLYPEKVFVQKKLRYGLSNLIQSSNNHKFSVWMCAINYSRKTHLF